MSKHQTSIALATYNGEAFVAEQIQSFCRQTVKPDELVIHDDVSSDSTVAVVKSLLDTLPFAASINPNSENLGYVRNFNAALSEVNGKVVFLSDQDDYWLPNKIERVLQVFRENPTVQLVIHDLEFCDSALTPQKQTKMERFRWHAGSLDHYVTGMATAIKGDFLKLCLPVPFECYTHDAWLHACARAINKRVILPEVLALYRRHESNATANLTVNHPKKLSPIMIMARRLFDRLYSADSALLRNEVKRDKVLLDWMKLKKAELLTAGYCTNNDFAVSLAKIDTKIETLQNRIEIRALNKMRRLLPAAKLHFNDGFTWQSLKSYLKDIVVK